MTRARLVFARVARAAAVGILTLAAGRLTLGARAEAPPSFQSPESIRTAARDVVLAASEGRAVDVETVAVDDRLQLPRCSAPLKGLLQSPLRSGRGTVLVRCPGEAGWQLFVPVRAIEQIAVLVTKRSIQSGEILRAEDFESTARPSTALPLEYLTDAQQAVGLTVRRTLPAGTVLAPGVLDYPQLVERGALVTLVSAGGPVYVKSEGVALEPGRLKQRVRVRSQSGRIIEGTVEAPGQVRVGS